MSNIYSEHELWEAYNSLIISTETMRIQKLLARYELFKMTLDIPGDIVECGVFKGAGWMYWLKLLNMYAYGEQKKVIGFDTFYYFANTLLDYEQGKAKNFVTDANFQGINPNDLLKFAQNAGFKNAEVVVGDVTEAIPEYVNQNYGFRISLLNLDLDTYYGTKVALENFYHLVVPGGIIILDEYSKRGWGESQAVDEFIENKPLQIRAVRGSSSPTAFIRK